MEHAVGTSALKTQPRIPERARTPPAEQGSQESTGRNQGLQVPQRRSLGPQADTGITTFILLGATQALTVHRETGCWESLIPPRGGPGARRASRGSPAPPSPGGQRGLREPSGLPHPWDIPSEGQLGPWTEQALKSHIRTHTYALTWDNGHVNVVPQVTSNSLNPTPVSV